MVVSLFFTLFFIFGSGYNTAGVFFTPVIKSFGWSRARLSTLQTALALAAGVSIPLVGWVLDRVEARFVMAAGAVMAGCGFITASLAHSYAAMIAAYLLIGLGIGAATLLPCSMVIANWFGARRGIAMGLAMAGTSVGRDGDDAGFGPRDPVCGMALRLPAARRAGLRNRDSDGPAAGPHPSERGDGSTVAEAATALPGLEVGAAVFGAVVLADVARRCFAFRLRYPAPIFTRCLI